LTVCCRGQCASAGHALLCGGGQRQREQPTRPKPGMRTPTKPPTIHHAPQLGPQSQSLSRSYGSVLPTSLTYICLFDQRLLTLETCCGYRVRPGTRFINSLRFSRTGQSALDTTEPWCVAKAKSISRGEPVPWTRLLTQKRELSPGLRPISLSLFALPHGRRRNDVLSVSRFRNIDLIPFRGGTVPKTSTVHFRISRLSA
jgi:hypothetical protein